MNRKQQAQAFLAGQLTPDEAKEYLEWLMSNDSAGELSEHIESAWNQNYEKDHPELDIEDTLRSIRVKTGYATQVRSRSGITIQWAIKVAAAITILAIATFLVYKPATTTVTQKIEWISKQNPAGQKSKIHLPDGSIVNLNAGSSITYRKDFINDRTVTLTGEAFFDVKKDPSRPFRVKSKEIITTALGTSFNINAYDAEDFVEVTLATGKVNVVDTVSRQNVQLIPGQGIIKTVSSGMMETFELSPQSIAAWRRGILNFNETPLSDVIKRLENWYDVKITVRGNTNEIVCSGAFDNEYLDNVLDVLSHSVGFEFEIDHKNITIQLNKP